MLAFKKKEVLLFFLTILSRSSFDHHLRCVGWLNFEFSKREKHSGWAIKTKTRACKALIHVLGVCVITGSEVITGPDQTWGELIVNANALIMHSFFPVIQGND